MLEKNNAIDSEDTFEGEETLGAELREKSTAPIPILQLSIPMQLSI